jgi:catechol 2,3-dioxygenase-like lactoylglutathione lyase family enzyme
MRSPRDGSVGRAMIDHVYIPVRDLATAEAFYLGALAPLGYTGLIERPGVAGLGPGRKPDFFLREGEPGDPVHVAFAAPDRATVDAFHAAALAAGGIDNGGPGPRPEYHPHYYGAFVLDPDGHNVEAVCHAPEPG